MNAIRKDHTTYKYFDLYIIAAIKQLYTEKK
jgi:hypothetical protein